jgi:hypothetical protein
VEYYLGTVTVPSCGRKVRGDVFDEQEAGSSVKWLRQNGMVGELAVVSVVEQPEASVVAPQVESPVVVEQSTVEPPVVVPTGDLLVRLREALTGVGKKKQIVALAEELGVEKSAVLQILTPENGFYTNNGWAGLKPTT